MIYTFMMLSLIIKELMANEISTLKRLWCILKSWRANHLEDMKEDTGRLEEYFLNKESVTVFYDEDKVIQSFELS